MNGSHDRASSSLDKDRNGDIVNNCDTVNDSLVGVGPQQLYGFALRSQRSGLGEVPAYTIVHLSCSHLLIFRHIGPKFSQSLPLRYHSSMGGLILKASMFEILKHAVGKPKLEVRIDCRP